MQLKYSRYDELAKKVKSQKMNIAIYGSGMIGTVIVPYLISEYDLFDNVLFFIDRDERKHGTKIQVGAREYVIVSPEVLKRLPENTILFITNSNYEPIIKMLDGISELDNTEGYIIPMLQVFDTHKKYDKYDVRLSEEPLIPKIIHYCWFSRNPMPDYLKKCMESWYKFCPDYKIVRWDEDNYDVNKNLYMKQAYEARKWGFVPDIARLDILYRYGGIYLDTDVELLRNIDDLLYQQAFAGVEKWGNVNMGGCSGATPNHKVIKQMLDFRLNEKFLFEDGSMNQTTCGYYETIPLVKLGMKPNNTIQQIEDMTVYSSDFFHPYDYMSGETHITENTFSIHHFNGGWLDEKSVNERKRTTEIYNQMIERMRVYSDV